MRVDEKQLTIVEKEPSTRGLLFIP